MPEIADAWNVNQDYVCLAVNRKNSTGGSRARAFVC